MPTGFTMENGNIAEQGPHWDLVEDDGKYAELYVTQS
jgi:ABC-type multidrug transport system fused ATPase/permease subunit